MSLKERLNASVCRGALKGGGSAGGGGGGLGVSLLLIVLENFELSF